MLSVIELPVNVNVAPATTETENICASGTAVYACWMLTVTNKMKDATANLDFTVMARRIVNEFQPLQVIYSWADETVMFKVCLVIYMES